MFIGHLPAGYICSKLIVNTKPLILIGMLGAIAPDFDLFYFYFIDYKQHQHHTYWSHYPIVWLGLSSFFLILYKFSVQKALFGIIFAINGFIHILLDSIVGGIWWFAPFIDKPFVLFTVPAIYDPWWLNFILHWSFALELFILAWAILIWYRN